MKILPLLPIQQGICGGTWARVISSFVTITSQQTTDRTLVMSFLDNVCGLFKKYPNWNCSGCSLGGICLHPVLTCLYMS